MKRAVLIVTTVLAVVLLLPAMAAGHAVLESSEPARGAALERVPDAVEFAFNESVEASFGSIRVFDRDGERVDSGETFRPDERSDAVAVRLDPELEDGVYTATYRVISADAHPVSGGITFTVGDPGAAPRLTVAELVEQADGGGGGGVALAIGKYLTYLATALLLGGVAFAVWIWGPLLGSVGGRGLSVEGRARFAARLRRLFIVALGFGVVGTIVGLLAQGVIGTGGSLADALKPDVLREVIGTRFGTVWSIRLLDFMALAALLFVPRLGVRVASGQAQASADERDSADATLTGGLAATAAVGLGLGFLAIAPGLAGHPGVAEPRTLALVASFAHVLAFSIWFGGLVLLVAALPQATRNLDPPARTCLLAGVIGRFSALALIAVAVLLTSGVVQAVLELDALSELVETGYGRALLVKATLLAGLIVLGAINRQRIRPRLRELERVAEPPGEAGRALRRTLRAEVALVLGVLVATAVLTALSPAGEAQAGPYSASVELGDAQLEMTVDPVRVGANEVHLYLLDRVDGSQFNAVKELSVDASVPSAGIGPIELDARKAGPGHYVIPDAQLGVAADWRLDIDARVSAFDQFEASVDVPIR